MGKNIKGGKKHKKYKNNNGPLRTNQLTIATEGQQYFVITKMLGDGRCLGNCSNGFTDVLCVIRGNMRKRKIWINVGDKVLGSLREFSTGKHVADIIHKYSEQEAVELQKSRRAVFPSDKNNLNDNLNDSSINDNDDFGFKFEDL